ncbi:hypothetical protein FRC08_016152, partial [Ceratobasidium sp. 394]
MGWLVLRFPLGLGWYRAQPCTRFRSLQHRKERMGVQHEFIVLNLADGSICRMERMGDPETRIGALTAGGIAARDIVQCFASNRISEAHLDTSDVIAEVVFPRELDILDVLRVCRAIHEGEKTCNYTLATFNCYFFTLAIQSVLTRCIVDWDKKITTEAWHSDLAGALSALSDMYKDARTTRNRTRYPVFLRLHLLLHPGLRWLELLVARLKNRLSNKDVSMQIEALTASALWNFHVKFAASHLLEGGARDTMEDTLRDQAYTPTGAIGDWPPGSVADQCDVLLKALVLRAISTHKQLEHKDSNLYGQLQEYMRLFQKFAPVPSGSKPRFVESQSALDFRQFKSPSPPLPVPTSQQPGANVLSMTQQIALWVAQPTLSLYGLVPNNSSENLDRCVTVEEEFVPTLAMLEDLASGGTIDVTLVAQQLDFLVNNKDVVIWDEWPWAHTYTSIKDKVCNTIYKGEQALLEVQLQDNNPAGLQAMSVSSFQDHLLNRIELHANLVGSFGLASADRVYSEIVDKLSQVWVLARNDEDPDFVSPTWSGAIPPPPPAPVRVCTPEPEPEPAPAPASLRYTLLRGENPGLVPWLERFDTWASKQGARPSWVLHEHPVSPRWHVTLQLNGRDVPNY